jgi:hypothetical protein
MSTITEDVYPLEKHENQVEKVIPAEGQGKEYLLCVLYQSN